MTNLASALTGSYGERVALCDASVNAVLRDLLAEVTVSQTYRNDEGTNIEAVYTFPLPLDAVLLELDVTLGGRHLRGVVVEKRAAEAAYESAVEAGDAAVMLELVEPGLYTVSVGNLMPEETATITFTWAMLYRWTGDHLRFLLPTTIAPRYGSSRHRPHQEPEASLCVENLFSLRIEILGCLRAAQFTCPSHAVQLETSADRAVLSLRQPKAVMDRDFILNVKAPQATRSFVLCGQDGYGLAAVASFQPAFPGLRQPKPLNLAIVIDCSSSMQGDSIAQARQALARIFDALQPADRITLIAFGNDTRRLAEQALACTSVNLARARHFAAALEADMGGTEIAAALAETYRVVANHGPRDAVADVFLITDGEVRNWKSVVEAAKLSGHRHFTVGVGSAVAEAFVRELAATTGGECELVSPNEGMAERIVRHFERMRAPRARRVEVRWPAQARQITPARVAAVFDGDTVVSCARFDTPPAAVSAILEVETDTGAVMRQELVFPPLVPAPAADGLSTVARVTAAVGLAECDASAGLATALRYRLISPWTNWLVVALREEADKACDLPALRKVPQTLAAGWGGTGRMTSYFANDCAFSFSDHFDAIDSRLVCADSSARMLPCADDSDDMPDSWRRLLELIDARPERLLQAGILALLEESGLADEFRAVLRLALDLGLDTDTVATILLARLLAGPMPAPASDAAKQAVAQLQTRGTGLARTLEDVTTAGTTFARALAGRVVRRILRSGPEAHALERFAAIAEMLVHLERSEQHWLRRNRRP